MRDKKVSIILGLSAVVVLLTVGFIGYTLFLKNAKVEVPDFLGKDKQEVLEWCGQLDSKYACEFRYEDSTTIEKDKIFQQSISAGNEMTGTITFTISSGLITPVSPYIVNENTKLADVQKWVSDSQLINVTYINENSDSVAKDGIIRIDPQGEIYSNTPVTIYVSDGPKESPESTDGDIEVKAGAYLNLTVADFEAKVKALGLVPNHNSDRDDSSSSVTKGNIVWHGSGYYEKGEKINYGICTSQTEGIVVKAGTYIGKTEEEFKKAATDLGLKANHNTDKDDYSSTVTKGNIVWHGSGTYEKNETFNYGLSLGSSSGTDDMYISKDKYVGMNEDEVKKITTDLGLKPTHLSDRDSYSSTVAKGKIITHGYGLYEKGEAFNYGLSLGSSSGSSGSDELYISKDQYVGKTEDEVKKIASDLGLKPTHLSDRDSYSTAVLRGNIVTHGYGYYENGEAFNYGLSLGPRTYGEDIVVSMDQYYNKTETEFKKIATDLGLVPTHISSRDSYSSSVAKGNIITHGYGTYEPGEAFNYGLSLGPNSSGGSSDTTKVTVEDKKGVSEETFKNYLSALGLRPGTVSKVYSSVEKGCIVSNDTGSFSLNDSVNYSVSLGKLTILSADTLNSLYQSEFSVGYDATEAYLKNNIFNNFSNVTYEGGNYGITKGYIASISVDGSTSYSEGAYYSGSEQIVVRIQNN